MIDTLGDLDRRSLAELDDLHYECEVHYRRRIMATGADSSARPAVFEEAYESLAAILGERRRRSGAAIGALGLAGDAAERIAEFVGPPPARLLDVGCGTGVLVQDMLARGYESHGIDVSPRLIATGRERMERDGRARGRGGALRCGNFLGADLEGDGPYDLVHSNDVLEHIHPDDAASFLRKAFRLLRPGGVLWLVTPNGWTGPGDATRLRHPPGTPSHGLHLKEYTLAELVALLRAAGFATILARLWGSGRRRQPTSFRRSFARLKAALEPTLAALPPRPRRRIMWAMDYACVLAIRPAAARSPGMPLPDRTAIETKGLA